MENRSPDNNIDASKGAVNFPSPLTVSIVPSLGRAIIMYLVVFLSFLGSGLKNQISGALQITANEVPDLHSSNLTATHDRAPSQSPGQIDPTQNQRGKTSPRKSFIRSGSQLPLECFEAAAIIWHLEPSSVRATLHSSPRKAIRHGGRGKNKWQEDSGSLFSWVGPLPDYGVASFHFMEEK